MAEAGRATGNGDVQWSAQELRALPPGYEKHHIVFLEAVHLPLADLPFDYTMDKYQNTSPDEITERIKPATIVISFLALYFASRKRVAVIDRNVKTSDEWLRTNSLTKKIWPAGPPLGCKQETLGIVGYGALGKRIESLCKVLGFKEILIAERRGSSTIREGRSTFEDVLERSTTLVLVCPRDADTINLIDEAELNRMRPDALVVNMARGGIVNEHALAKALREGRIFGAATDVFDTEPAAPGTTPLLPDLSKGEQEVPNLLVTSHVAWFSGSTIQTLQSINREGMTAFVEGRMYDPKARACVVVHDGKIWK